MNVSTLLARRLCSRRSPTPQVYHRLIQALGERNGPCGFRGKARALRRESREARGACTPSARSLPLVRSKSAPKRSGALRAAINTPVQGTAADLVSFAMVRLHESPALAELGFRLVLQIHDEARAWGSKS